MVPRCFCGLTKLNFWSKYDRMFRRIARSSRAASGYLTHSAVHFRASMDTANSTNLSDSLLGNLQTKIFPANACSHTNEYTERLFSQELQATRGISVGASRLTGSITWTMRPNLTAFNAQHQSKGGATQQSGRRLRFPVWQARERRRRKTQPELVACPIYARIEDKTTRTNLAVIVLVDVQDILWF